MTKEQVEAALKSKWEDLINPVSDGDSGEGDGGCAEEEEAEDEELAEEPAAEEEGEEALARTLVELRERSRRQIAAKKHTADVRKRQREQEEVGRPAAGPAPPGQLGCSCNNNKPEKT